MGRSRPVVAGVVFAVVAAVTTLAVAAALRDLRAARLTDREVAADAAASVFRDAFQTAEADAGAVAADLGTWDGSPAAEARAVERLRELASDLLVAGAWVVDAGRIIRATDPAHAALLGRVASGEHVEAALRGRSSWSSVVEDPVDGVLQLELATPLAGPAGDPTTGVVVTPLPLTEGPLARRLATLPTPPGTDLEFVAADGAVVPVGRTLDRIERDDPEVVGAVAEGPGAHSYRGEAGVARIGAVADAGGGWSVVLHGPAAAFERRFRDPLLAVGAGTAALAVLGIGTVVSEERRVRRAQAAADRAKRSMLAVAGHELRTPLTVVRGMAQTLHARWDAVPDTQRRELVGGIQRHARTLDHLVERLLYAAQLEAGVAGTVTNRPVEVSPVVEAAVAHHAELSSLHTFAVDAEPGVVASADPKALDQVLFHLLDNAVKYSPSGGAITVTASRSRTGVSIAVDDEGVGLPSETASLFEPFTQREDVDTRTHDEGGVGLGLYIVGTLVRHMGGTVRAQRRPVGARFVVELPAPPD